MVDRYLQITWIIAIFSLFYIFMLVSGKKRIWYYLLPFFVFTGMIILRTGVFNLYTFVDSDMTAHQGIINMMLDRNLFRYDAEMQFFWKIFPRGYYIILLPFVLMGIPAMVISKLLGLLSGLLIPFLLYRLALVVYAEKRTAYFCALFSYTLIPLYEVSFSGTPRTIGIILYLLALISLFKYLKDRSLFSLFCLGIFMLLIFHVHQVSFVLLVIPVATFLTLYLIRNVKRKKSFLFSLLVILSLGLIMALFISYLINKFSFLDFSNRIFIIKDAELLIRNSDFLITLPGMLKEIGILPICFIIFYAVLRKVQKTGKYPLQNDFFIVSIFLFFFTFLAIQFEAFFSVLAYRYPPFLALFFYFTGLPIVVNMILDRCLRKKIILLVIIAFSLIPTISYVHKRLWWWVYPYGYHRLVQVYPKPKINFQDDIKWSKELFAVGSYLGNNTPIDTVIACPMWCGDLIRLYSKRNVTSSWKIGGSARVSKKAGYIYREYVDNSKKLYNDPDYLYRKYNASYFVFDKSAPGLLKAPGAEVFATENLKVVKIME